MGKAQFTDAALFKRSSWKKTLDESKIDMGLMDPFSQDALDASLFAAVVEDNHRAIREMAVMGANAGLVCEEGSLLHYAVRKSSLKTVIALLQAGADPFARDATGQTPRDIAKQRLSGSKMRTVLKIWEQRRMRVENDGQGDADDLQSLLRAAS